MNDAIGLAEAMLGLDGLRVLDVVENPSEVVVTVETTAEVAGCGTCGVRAEAQDRLRVDVRDLPFGGRPVRLVLLKRRWRCVDLDCPAKTWTEECEHVAPRSVITELRERNLRYQLEDLWLDLVDCRRHSHRLRIRSHGEIPVQSLDRYRCRRRIVHQRHLVDALLSGVVTGVYLRGHPGRLRPGCLRGTRSSGIATLSKGCRPCSTVSRGVIVNRRSLPNRQLAADLISDA